MSPRPKSAEPGRLPRCRPSLLLVPARSAFEPRATRPPNDWTLWWAWTPERRGVIPKDPAARSTAATVIQS